MTDAMERRDLTPKEALMRRCKDCIGFKNGYCNINQAPTREINYGCRKHTTAEEWEKHLEYMEKRLASVEITRVNYMLTLMYTFIQSAMVLMERSEAALGKWIGGKEWRFERKRALNKIMADIEEIRSLNAVYFEKDFIDMMSDYGREDFDDTEYDNFVADAGDFLRLGLTFYEHCYRRPSDKEEAIAKIRQMPHDLNLFEDNFIDSFKIKR